MGKESDRGIGPNLTLFFGRFLNTAEEMDGYLEFRSTRQKAPGFLEAETPNSRPCRSRVRSTL
jgi:hypothetical protein